jgi:hypothetical protein
MAAIKRMTGARMLMHEADVPVLEDGGNSDFRFYPKGRGAVYEPVKVDQALKDGDKVRLGATELTVHHHPGHTMGATSFTFTARDGGRDYRIGIINMNGINDGVLLLKSPGYPRIVEEYAQTFAKQKQISLDVFLSSHAGQFRLHEKYKTGDSYDPNRFVGPKGYRTAVERAEQNYLEQLQKERRSPARDSNRHQRGGFRDGFRWVEPRTRRRYSPTICTTTSRLRARVSNSSSTICCHVPITIAPSRIGRVTDGPTMAART